jgi:hypothetical protein
MKPYTLATALALAGCSTVQDNPDIGAAKTLAPFNAALGFARVSVPAESALLGASLDGAPAFCTPFPAYFVLGDRRGVCFLDTANSGYFDGYYILGTLRGEVFAAHVPYVVTAAAPAVQASEAAAARCDYEAQVATVNSPGLLARLADYDRIYGACLRAAAVR